MNGVVRNINAEWNGEAQTASQSNGGTESTSNGASRQTGVIGHAMARIQADLRTAGGGMDWNRSRNDGAGGWACRNESSTGNALSADQASNAPPSGGVGGEGGGLGMEELLNGDGSR